MNENNGSGGVRLFGREVTLGQESFLRKGALVVDPDDAKAVLSFTREYNRLGRIGNNGKAISCKDMADILRKLIRRSKAFIGVTTSR